MVDSFTVENWRDGEKSTWLCFKNQGSPQVTMLAKEPSSEPSGLKVSFVFEDDEVMEFTKQLTKQLKYFPVKPIITGGEGVAEWDDLPAGWETKDYFYSKQRNVASYNRTHFVVMGNVAYDLREHEVDQEHRTLFRESLTLKVPIGAVDIPPSRENLEYTKKTKAKLNEMLVKLRKEYNDDFLKEINACTDYLSLRKIFVQANSMLISLRKFTFQGKEYTWNELSSGHVDTAEILVSVKQINSRYANVFRSSNISMSEICAGTATFLINDLGQGHLKHIKAEYTKITSGAYIIDPVKGTKKTRQDLFDQDFQRASKFLGKDPILLSSIIGMPMIVKGAAGRAKPDQIFKVTRNGYTVKSSVESVTDIPTEGYMLPMSGWDVEGGFFKGKVSYLGSLAKDLDKPVYLVRKFTRKSVVGLGDASHLSAALDKLLVPRIKSYLDAEKLRGLLSQGAMSHLDVVDWKNVDNTIYLLLKFHKRMLKHGMNHSSYSTANKLISDINITSTAFVSTRTMGFINTYNTRWKKLVEALCYGWNSKENFIHLHTFIKENK
jgi:hypothetical protein